MVQVTQKLNVPFCGNEKWAFTPEPGQILIKQVVHGTFEHDVGSFPSRPAQKVIGHLSNKWNITSYPAAVSWNHAAIRS